ncbi:MAG: 16S rRNA (uracil(1498)-N(3))-methyltransferase [Flavobacteriales bacterium]|nr:16S rRNA (uracil(1498)-N(3))-methyltransferase [Flavobacteriales bacterium]
MNLFYAPNCSAGECTLGEEESKHALKVLRLAIGDSIQVTDGKGKCYKAAIASLDSKCCKVDLLNALPTPARRLWSLHIAIAPTKNNSRLEWFLEKACEIGVDSITPILCEHSERRKIKTERLEKILLGAMKQSQQYYLPVLNPLMSFDEFLSVTGADASTTYMASYKDGNKELVDACQPGQHTTVMIGPEGDFSEAEKERAKLNGIVAVNLGQTRLRTETAGIVAAHTFAMINKIR